MNSTVFIRIYKVHYSDIPVCTTLSINLKVCGKFTIESMREECDHQDPNLLHLHVTVRFNRLEDALDAINRYNNTRFMNRYSMKVAFYRPSSKQNRDRSQETEYQKTFRITSKERTVSTREEKVVERKRSRSIKRSPQRQRRRQSSSSSDISTSSSSSSNNGSSCKDIRSRLSTVRSKPSALPRRSEHASRSRSRYSYKEKVKQAIKRRVSVVPSTSSSETSCSPVTSETDSSPSSSVGKHSIIPRSEEIYKNIDDVLRSIRDGPSDNELTLKAVTTTISNEKSEKETKKVKFSPIKFGHTPMTNQKTKVQEARKLVVPKSRKNSRRIVSMVPSQILPSNEIPRNNLSVKMDNQEMQSDCTASSNSCTSDKSIATLGDKNSPREIDSIKENIKPDDLPVNPKELDALEEKTLLPDNNVDVPNQTRKIQFNIKNSSTLVKDKMLPNPLHSNELYSPNNSKASPEDMSKRKRNKSEKSAPSFISKIPSTSSGLVKQNIQKLRLFKSKSFQSYEVADIIENNLVQYDHLETTKQACVQPDITSLVSKLFVDFYQNKLINRPTSEITPSEVHQVSNVLPLKTDDFKDCSAKEDRVGYGPSPQIDTPTAKSKEAIDNEASEHKHSHSIAFQPIGTNEASEHMHLQFIAIKAIEHELENRSTNHKIQCDDTSSPLHSEALDSDQSILSDNLSTTSVPFSEDKPSMDTHADESSPRVDTVIQCIDFNQSSVSATDETLHLKEDLQRHNNTHSCSVLQFPGSKSNKVATISSSSSVVQIATSVSTSVTTDTMMKDDLDGNPSEKTSPCLDQIAFELNHANIQIPLRTSCDGPVISSSPVNIPSECQNLGLSEPEEAQKESTIQDICCEQNVSSTKGQLLIDPPVSSPGPDSDLTDSAMDATPFDSTQIPKTTMPFIEPSESSISVLCSDTPLQHMDTASAEPTDSLNKLKRPISEDIDHSEEKINSKPSTNPAKRQKQDDDYVCSLVKPYQMSFLLGEKEKLEKLYNEECRTVCNAVQLLVSQDPSLEKHIEKSLSQTLENIGEKYISLLQETVLELSEFET